MQTVISLDRRAEIAVAHLLTASSAPMDDDAIIRCVDRWFASTEEMHRVDEKLARICHEEPLLSLYKPVSEFLDIRDDPRGWANPDDHDGAWKWRLEPLFPAFRALEAAFNEAGAGVLTDRSEQLNTEQCDIEDCVARQRPSSPRGAAAIARMCLASLDPRDKGDWHHDLIAGAQHALAVLERAAI